jgi:hypothetical protein
MSFAFSITTDVAIANFWTTTNQTLQENKVIFKENWSKGTPNGPCLIDQGAILDKFWTWPF